MSKTTAPTPDDENPEEDNETRTPPVDPSIAAEAASAHARVNIPLNLDNWRHLPEHVSAELLWFHQWILDNRANWNEATDAIGYDRSTVFRVLKGTYKTYDKVIIRIRSFRKIAENRGAMLRQEFRPNAISNLIFAGLSYALANNSIAMIIGESRMGKSTAVSAFQTENNHGRCVLVTAPPLGGPKMLLRAIASAVGVNKNLNLMQMVEAIYRAFNKNRILIVDEAHRLIPSDSRHTNPQALECLRDIHDATTCGLAFIATARFADRLHASSYMFEQLLGRTGMPIQLPRLVQSSDVLPIIVQFLPNPSPATVTVLTEMANQPGRFGMVVETLRVASKIASQAKAEMTDQHVSQAIKLRTQMMGELMYARKRGEQS